MFRNAMRTLLGIVLATALAGCVTQRVTPVAGITGERVCIVRNHAVWPEFLDIYASRLRMNGYDGVIVGTNEEATSCPIRSTYVAHRGMHWGMYLAKVDIRVSRGDTLVGEAVYSAPRATPAKHGRIEPKIYEIVDRLFPPVSR